MTNRFLTTSTDASTTDLQVNSLTALNLSPSQYLKTDSTKRLISIAGIAQEDVDGLLVSLGSLEEKTQLLTSTNLELTIAGDVDLETTRAIKRARYVTSEDVNVLRIRPQNGATTSEINLLGGTITLDTDTQVNLTTAQININTSDIKQNSIDAQLVICPATTYNTRAGVGAATGTDGNSSFGTNAGSAASTVNNTAIGTNVLSLCTSYNNTAVGSVCLESLTSGICNSALGTQALASLSTGSFNVGIGYNCGIGVISGSDDNICIGADSNASATTCTSCIAIGKGSQTTNTTNSIVIGAGATASTSNTCVLGNASVSVIRNMGVGTCDLGSSANKFKDGWFGGAVSVPAVKSLDQTASIALTPNNIDLTSTTLTRNSVSATIPELYSAGSSVKINTTGGGTGTLNTLIGKDAYLGGSSFEVVAVGSNAAKVASQSGITAVGANALQSTTDGANTVSIGTYSGNNVTSSSSDVFIGWASGLNAPGSSSGNVCIGRNATLPPGSVNSFVLGGFTTGESGAFTYNTSRLQHAGDNASDLGATNHQFKDCYLGGNLKCTSINSLTPFSGAFMLTNQASQIILTALETDVLAGSSSVGTLSVLDWQVSSYRLHLYGTFTGINNDTCTIRVYSGPTSATLLATLPVTLNPSLGTEHCDITIDFAVQVLGAPGAAKICSNIAFTYSDSGTQSWWGDRLAAANNTTFSTTVLNTLKVTAQFSSSVGNAMQIIGGGLTRIY